MKKSLKAVIFYLSAVMCLGVANSASAGECWRREGPFNHQSQAEQARYNFQARGFATSNVWGEGGLYGNNWAARRYFFNIFYRC